MELSYLELRLAVAAVETGTLLEPATYLMHAGFASRLAAIKAIKDGWLVHFGPRIGSVLRSRAVIALVARASWPTLETHSLWMVCALF